MPPRKTNSGRPKADTETPGDAAIYDRRELERAFRDRGGDTGEGTFEALLRYYAKEDIVDGAQGRGPGRKYSHRTLLQLLLARILRHRGLTSTQIRAAVSGTVEEMESEFARLTTPAAVDHAPYYFLSCRSSWDRMRKLAQERDVEVLFHCCGTSPWLAIVRPRPLESIHSLPIDRRSIVLISHTVASEDVRQFGPSVEGDDPVLETLQSNIIFLSRDDSGFDEVFDLVESRTTSSLRPIRLFRIFGEFDFALEARSTDLKSLFDFLRWCAERGFVTSTKRALVTWKYGFDFPSYYSSNRLRAEKAKQHGRIDLEELPMALACRWALAKRPELLWIDNRDQRLEETASMVRKRSSQDFPELIAQEISNLRLESSAPEAELTEEFAVHGFSVDIRRAGWSHVLCFVKAKLGGMVALEADLQKLLVVQQDNWIASRILRITGQHDFLVPIYCRDDQQTIDDIASQLTAGSSVEGSVIQIATTSHAGHNARTKPGAALTRTEQRLITRILQANSIDDVYDATLQAFTSAGSADALEHLRGLGWSEPDDRTCTANSILQAIGVLPRVEIRGWFQSALLRFYLMNGKTRGRVHQEMHEFADKSGIILETFDPIHRPLEVMALIRFHDKLALELLLKKIRPFCLRSEHHMVCGQILVRDEPEAPKTKRGRPKKRALARPVTD
jgi:hypothetical protein